MEEGRKVEAGWGSCWPSRPRSIADASVDGACACQLAVSQGVHVGGCSRHQRWAAWALGVPGEWQRPLGSAGCSMAGGSTFQAAEV